MAGMGPGRMTSTVSMGAGKFGDLIKQATEAAKPPAEDAAELHSFRPSVTATTHSLAGASGALIAMALVYPLDNLRTRLQVSKKESRLGMLAALEEILKTEGWRGLYAGLGSALLGVGTSWAVYYYFYALFKQWLAKKYKTTGNSTVQNLLVAMGSGVISAVISNPIWVVNTRLKLKKKDEPDMSFWAALKKLAREEGVGGLMSGVVPSLILVTNPAIQFAVYEKLKQVLLMLQPPAQPSGPTSMFGGASGGAAKGKAKDLRAVEFFLIGAVAKLISTVATYPYQVVKSRMHLKGSERYGGVWDCIAKIVELEGPAGLYRGMESKLLATILTSAIMFMSYEKILESVVALTTEVESARRNPLKLIVPPKPGRR